MIVVGKASPSEPSLLGSTPRKSKSRLGISQDLQCSRHASEGENSPPGFFVCDSKLKWINQNKRHIIRSPAITAIPKGRNPTSYNATCQTAGCRHVVLGVDFVSRSGLSSAVCNGTLQLAGETRRLDMENWLSEMERSSAVSFASVVELLQLRGLSPDCGGGG